KDNGHGKQNSLQNMIENVMSHFVPHHKKDFFFVKLVEQGVPEDDALGASKARDVSVDRFRVRAFVDFEHPSAVDASPVGQSENLSFQLLVLHLAEVVKKRFYPDWLDQDQEKNDGYCQDSRIQPPAPWALLHEEIGSPQEEHAKRYADHQS